MIYSQWDIVIVPFPFVNSLKSKPRPIVILSAHKFNKDTEHYIGAMITSSEHSAWFGDMEIIDLNGAGLTSPSKVRMKIFTLDHRVIKRQIGTLSENDRRILQNNIEQIISCKKQS